MKTNANQFWDKYSNSGVRYFQENGLQCYAWAVKYCEENGWFENGIPYVRDDAVKNLFFDWDNQKTYKGSECIRRVRVKVTANNPHDPNQIPPANSVVIYDKTAYNPYGHIEIVHESNTQKMLISAQNLGSGNGEGDDDMPKKTWRGYSELPILGWLEEITQNVTTPTPQPKSRDVRTEMRNAAKYFYEERVMVIATAYDNSDKDYLMNEIIWSGQSSDRQNQEIQKLKENMQKISIPEIKPQEMPKLEVKEVSPNTLPEKPKEEVKTVIIEPVSKSKTIFESKKAIMSLIATFITFGVSIANQYWKMDLKVEEIIGIVSPLLIGVISQASTEIGK